MSSKNHKEKSISKNTDTQNAPAYEHACYQQKLKQRICEEVFDAFGGNLYEIVVGGAPFNKEVESFLKA